MIDNLSDQEKSVMLGKAMGWETFKGAHTKRIFAKIDGVQHDCELYDPANMALAWRVLNWAWNHGYDMGDGIAMWWYAKADQNSTVEDTLLIDATPADAQRAWLDKILTLCIEAGLVEVDSK